MRQLHALHMGALSRAAAAVAPAVWTQHAEGERIGTRHGPKLQSSAASGVHVTKTNNPCHVLNPTPGPLHAALSGIRDSASTSSCDRAALTRPGVPEARSILETHVVAAMAGRMLTTSASGHGRASPSKSGGYARAATATPGVNASLHPDVGLPHLLAARPAVHKVRKRSIQPRASPFLQHHRP